MNTEIGREIKKKKFYSNKNLSQRRAIHNRMHKRYAFEIYIYIYTWSKLMKELYEVRTI